MAEVGFHLDEHIATAVAQALRRVGIDVETTPESGLRGAPDADHLSHAHAHQRVVVTEDRDYEDLHYAGEAHSGIAYFPKGPHSVGVLVESLTLLHATYTAEEMVGRLEYL